MSKSPSVVPEAPLADDEIVMLALTAGQAALAKYVEPGNRSAEETIETILGILDHQKVVQATLHKLHSVLRARERRDQNALQPGQPRGIAGGLNPYFHP